MIKIRRSDERGHADHGWLDTYHTFSFANYQDPEHMGFSVLRVVNQDTVTPGSGFPTHGHRDMEIISYVLDGVLEHKDNMGNGSQMRPGEVQIMSAGKGVTHSEFNGSSDQPLEFLQMWILPADQGGAPRYEQKDYPITERQGRMRLVVDPDGAEGAVQIGQDARMYAGRFDAGESTEFALPAGRKAWVHVGTGSVRVAGEELRKGDGMAIADLDQVTIEGIEAADVVLWDLP